jgi:LacI family transcriptional regulator
MSTEPLYQQVKSLLESQILDGALKEGELIPSERELREGLGVSSTTVRRALAEMVRDGLIVRRPGIGSFVSSDSKQLSLLLLIVGFDAAAWHADIFGNLIGGIAEVTWEQRTTFSVVHMPEGSQDVAAYLRNVAQEATFDGVLLRLAGDLQEEWLIPLLEAGLPYVAIKRYLPHRLVNCVVYDDVRSGFRATEHLIELGHTRIGLVVCPRTTMGRDRKTGYSQALETHGIGVDAGLMHNTESFMGEAGFTAIRHLLALPERPTAIFLASDRLASGCYRAIEEAGLQIPNDLSVVGHGDIPTAAVFSPPLTTMRLSYRDLGMQSASLLIDLINRKVRPPQRVVIEGPLIVRESSGPLRAPTEPDETEISVTVARSTD